MAQSGGAFLPSDPVTFTNTMTCTGTATFSGTTTLSGTVTASGITLSSPTITTPTVTTPSITGVTTVTNTTTSASLGTVRYLYSDVTMTPATSVTASSAAAVRGSLTLSAGKTLTDGFFYGAQGKFVGTTGTMAEVSAGRIAGVIGQVDLGTMTITAGQVSCVWADLQGSGPTFTSTQVNIIRATNSSATTCNAMIFFYGQSTYLFTAARDGGAPTYFGATAPTSLAKSLKIDVAGTTYYIGLYTAAS